MKIEIELIKETTKQIVNIHDLIIDVSGGQKGIRDEGGLEHAVYTILSIENKERKSFLLAAKVYQMLAMRHYFF